MGESSDGPVRCRVTSTCMSSGMTFEHWVERPTVILSCDHATFQALDGMFGQELPEGAIEALLGEESEVDRLQSQLAALTDRWLCESVAPGLTDDQRMELCRRVAEVREILPAATRYDNGV